MKVPGSSGITLFDELLRFCLAQLAAERFESFRADVMLDAFGIDPCCIGADTQTAQEGFDHLMPVPAPVCQLLAAVTQENASIWLLNGQAFANHPLQHLGDGRLRNAEARSNVHLTRFAASVDQVGDQLGIVLHERRSQHFSRAAKALRVLLSVGKRAASLRRFLYC
jgi:hypothetical protein